MRRRSGPAVFILARNSFSWSIIHDMTSSRDVGTRDVAAATLFLAADRHSSSVAFRNTLRSAMKASRAALRRFCSAGSNGIIFRTGLSVTARPTAPPACPAASTAPTAASVLPGAYCGPTTAKSGRQCTATCLTPHLMTRWSSDLAADQSASASRRLSFRRFSNAFQTLGSRAVLRVGTRWHAARVWCWTAPRLRRTRVGVGGAIGTAAASTKGGRVWVVRTASRRVRRTCERPTKTSGFRVIGSTISVIVFVCFRPKGPRRKLK